MFSVSKSIVGPVQHMLTICNEAKAKYFECLPEEGRSIQLVNPDIFGEQSKPLRFWKSGQEMMSITWRGLIHLDRHTKLNMGNSRITKCYISRHLTVPSSNYLNKV
jgi:hypothetical protein